MGLRSLGLCMNPNYTVVNNNYHYLISSHKYDDYFEEVSTWTRSFYRDPKRNSAKSIQQSIRPEVTEIGCAVILCGTISYTVCAHGKITCSGDCIVYDKGETCSKCPNGSKCSVDGLCSTRKDLEPPVFRINPEDEYHFVTQLNIARTKIASGNMMFDFTESQEMKEVWLPTASKMMEVKWSHTATTVAENALMDYCGNGSEVPYNKGKYHLAATQYSQIWGLDFIPWVFFDMAQTEFPLFIKSEYAKSNKYSEWFSESRRNILTGRDDITDIGCAYDYCRDHEVVVCAFGEITCTSNCTVYEKGKTCSNCPKGSKCTFDGLCSFREEATTKFTKISKKDQTKIVNKINEVRSIIAIGEQEYSVEENGEIMQKKLASATGMMEVEWSASCLNVAETKMKKYCKDGVTTLPNEEFRIVAWNIAVREHPANISRSSKSWKIKPNDHFSFTGEEVRPVLTAEDLEDFWYTDIFIHSRFDTWLSWASVSEIGCAMEYCRGDIVLMCAMGSFGNCTDNCPVYQSGTPCTDCPENTECLRNGLCRKNRILDDEEGQFIAETMKGSKSTVSTDIFRLLYFVVFILMANG